MLNGLSKSSFHGNKTPQSKTNSHLTPLNRLRLSCRSIHPAAPFLPAPNSTVSTCIWPHSVQHWTPNRVKSQASFKLPSKWRPTVLGEENRLFFPHGAMWGQNRSMVLFIWVESSPSAPWVDYHFYYYWMCLRCVLCYLSVKTLKSTGRHGSWKTNGNKTVEYLNIMDIVILN